MVKRSNAALACMKIVSLWPALCSASGDKDHNDGKKSSVQVGPRPFYLVDKMDPSPLKRKLQQCSQALLPDGFFDRPSWRRHAAVSGAHQGKPRGRRAHGSRHSGV